MPGDAAPALTSAQSLLLTVILAPETTAIAAWERLRNRFSVQALDVGSFQVMPMLAERLTALDLGHPDLPRLRGIRRQAAWRARLAAHDAAAFVAAVHRCGSPTLTIDGPALSPLLYGDTWQRPVTGAEVLVPAAGIARACELLAADRWRPRGRLGIAYRARVRRPMRWSGPGGLQCTLRCDLPRDLGEQPSVDRDALWLAALAVQMDDVHVRVAAPVDVVHHLTLARKRAAPDRRCLWAVDVARALAHPALDQTELRRRLDASAPDSPLRNALHTLAELGVRAAAQMTRQDATSSSGGSG